LTDAGHKNIMMDVRAYRSTYADSNHYLVITRRRAKMCRSKYVVKKQKTVKCNVSRLKPTAVRKEY
jgi:hypothetical protein